MILDALVGSLCEAGLGALPLVLAGVGELVGERSGMINIGIEGMMLGGCLAAFAVAAMTGSAALGLAAGLAAGVVLAGVLAAVALVARADQVVTGLAINLLAVGATGTAWNALQAAGYDHLPPGAGWNPGLGAATSALAAIPVLGSLLAPQYPLLYAVILLCVMVAAVDQRTRAGLMIRAVGDAPDACAAMGVPVRRVRAGCLLFAGACAGSAGAYLSIMRTHEFIPLMSGGQGYLVLALVIFGRWTLRGLLAGAVAFAVVVALCRSLRSLPGSGFWAAVPDQAIDALPYLLALVALLMRSRAAAGPLALGQPWPQRS